MDGAIQTNDHTIGFVKEVVVVWHVNYRILYTV